MLRGLGGDAAADAARGSRSRSITAGARPRAVRLVSMKARMRSSVSVVMRPPLRSRGGELAVVDGAAAEGRFRKPALAAIVGDFLQQFLRVHGAMPRLGFAPRLRVPHFRADVFSRAGTAAQRTKGRVPRQPQNVPSLEWAMYGQMPNIEKCRLCRCSRCGVRAVVMPEMRVAREISHKTVGRLAC